MTTLVLLDHDRGEIKQASRSAVAAALSLGEVHALVPGAAVAATAASRLAGVSKVLLAESDLLTHALAEPLAALIAAQAEGYSHICAAATTIGKNVIPRVAGLLGVQPISDVVAIVDQQTFIRPIYAGNALATLRSDDKIKLLTIRAASFDPVAVSGGAAPIVAVASPAIDAGMARFVSAERSVSPTTGIGFRTDRRFRRARAALSGEFRPAGEAGRPPGRGHRRLARGRRCRVRRQ